MRPIVPALLPGLVLLAACSGNEVRDGASSEGAQPAPKAPPPRVVLYAAVSLQPALEEIVNLYSERTHGQVAASYASSAVLAKQVENGGPGDIFVSANPDWMDYLEIKELVEPGTRFDVVGNSLVIVAPAAEPFDFDPSSGESLADAFEGLISIGEGGHVPLGIYSKQALARAGWWDALQSRQVPTMDARNALLLVERGECAAGILYASDAAGSEFVRVVAPIPEEWHDRIVYPAAIVAGHDRPEVRTFLEILASREGADVLWAHGFLPVDRAAPGGGAAADSGA